VITLTGGGGVPVYFSDPATTMGVDLHEKSWGPD